MEFDNNLNRKYKKTTGHDKSIYKYILYSDIPITARMQCARLRPCDVFVSITMTPFQVKLLFDTLNFRRFPLPVNCNVIIMVMR